MLNSKAQQARVLSVKNHSPSDLILQVKELTKNFNLHEQGKILPRRITGVTVQQQKKIAKAVKRARILSLLPFVASNY